MLKFLNEIAHYKGEMARLVNEIAELKVKNNTLMMLVEDKSSKLQYNETALREVKKERKEKDEKIEKLEFLNQKLNDDFVV